MPADATLIGQHGPITVITATWLETWITRLVLRRAARVVHVGVGAVANLTEQRDPIIVCGLAGALTTTLKPGAVVIPARVGSASGDHFVCDPALVAALTSAARLLGYKVASAPVLTSSSLVTGANRARWATQGFVAVDMESAPLLGRGVCGAVVRVVLDTPERELSATWEHPLSTLARPTVWVEAARLAVDAPRATYRAARVVKRALQGR